MLDSQAFLIRLITISGKTHCARYHYHTEDSNS